MTLVFVDPEQAQPTAACQCPYPHHPNVLYCQTAPGDHRKRIGQFNLTHRELDVARLLVVGESNKQISRRLSIGLCTVKKHVAAILTKTCTGNRTAAVHRLLTIGAIVENT